MKNILPILLLLVLCSCNAKLEEKENSLKEFYSGGELKSKINIQNGKKNGLGIFYYQSGLISSVGYYKDNMAEGRWIKFFDTTGRVMFIENLSSAKKQGVLYRFFPSGYLKGIENYNEDTLCGRMTHFYDGKDMLLRSIPEVNSKGNSEKYIEYDTLGNPHYYKGKLW